MQTKSLLLICIVLQMAINVWLYKKIPGNTVTMPEEPKVAEVLSQKRSMEVQDPENVTEKEIYVYTLEIDEDLRSLAQEVYSLKNTMQDTKKSQADDLGKTSDSIKEMFPLESIEEVLNIQQNFETLSGGDKNGPSFSDTNLSPEQSKFMDLNNDGKFSEHELRMLLKFRTNAIKTAKKRDIQDGTLPTRQEHYDGDLKRFGFIDQNKDGEMTLDEYMAYRRLGYTERRRFDLNHDRELTIDEWGQGEVRFKKVDYDQDGIIQEWEIRRALYKGYW